MFGTPYDPFNDSAQLVAEALRQIAEQAAQAAALTYGGQQVSGPGGIALTPESGDSGGGATTYVEQTFSSDQTTYNVPPSVSIVNLSSTTNVTLHGAVLGPGRVVTLYNGGAFTITLPDESSSAEAASQRWDIPGGGSLSLGPGETAEAWHDPVSDRNVILGGSALATTQYTDEMAYDAAATLIGNGSHAGITFSHNDGADSLSASVTYGSTAGTACVGNDSRLSDARAPTGAAGGDLTGTYPNPTITADAVSYTKMQNVSATQRALGRNSSGAGDVEEVTLSQLLDWIGSAAQGDILYRGASAWARLAAGTSGQFLQTQGTGANPVWADAPASGERTEGTLAAAGSVQGDAAAIVDHSTTVTGADGTKGVILPSGDPAGFYLVRNANTLNSLKVYPHSGAAIDAGTNGASTLAALTTRVYWRESSTQWRFHTLT